jgi:hypothetical protein
MIAAFYDRSGLEWWIEMAEESRFFAALGMTVQG